MVRRCLWCLRPIDADPTSIRRVRNLQWRLLVLRFPRASEYSASSCLVSGSERNNCRRRTFASCDTAHFTLPPTAPSPLLAVYLFCADTADHSALDPEECRDEVDATWQRNVVAPITQSCRPDPKLIFLPSPYRFVLMPLVEHILQAEHDHPDRQIAVLVPELVVKHWWQAPLHNQRAQLLKLLFLVRGNQRIMVINSPWYL